MHVQFSDAVSCVSPEARATGVRLYFENCLRTTKGPLSSFVFVTKSIQPRLVFVWPADDKTDNSYEMRLTQDSVLNKILRNNKYNWLLLEVLASDIQHTHKTKKHDILLMRFCDCGHSLNDE